MNRDIDGLNKDVKKKYLTGAYKIWQIAHALVPVKRNGDRV